MSLETGSTVLCVDSSQEEGCNLEAGKVLGDSMTDKKKDQGINGLLIALFSALVGIFWGTMQGVSVTILCFMFFCYVEQFWQRYKEKG